VEWKKAEKTDAGIKLPTRWVQLHYFEAFNMLFRLENALRVFVYSVLKTEFHGKWDAINISVDEGEGCSEKTIASIAKKRLAQSQAYGYLGHSVSCPIMHLTSGELTRLITSDSYWKLFRYCFPGKLEVVAAKFEEIGTIRNSLAHFRPVRPDDVDVIRQNSKQVLSGVEVYLSQVLSQGDVVPTNTSDEWYKLLGALGNEFCEFKFTQSKDGSFVRIQLTYSCPVLKAHIGEKRAAYRILTLKSAPILEHHDALRNNIVYLCEDVSFAWGAVPTEQPVISKNVSLVIPRQNLASTYADIERDVRALLSEIQDETNLIREDNLARGELVESVHASAKGSRDEKSGEVSWEWNTDRLSSPVQADDVPEYWGELSWTGWGDFIAGTSQYPWMPGLVSGVDIGF